MAVSTLGLNLKNGGSVANGTMESADDTNFVPHFKVSGGTLTMNNVTVDVNHCLNANSSYTEASAMEISNATAILNNCHVNIHNGDSAIWVFSYGISLTNGNLTMNGGSITATCVEGTAANGPTNPYAICGIGNSTATLNDVAVTAIYYATTVNGHLTVNTTDTTITSTNIVDNAGGSHTLDYMD